MHANDLPLLKPYLFQADGTMATGGWLRATVYDPLLKCARLAANRGPGRQEVRYAEDTPANLHPNGAPKQCKLVVLMVGEPALTAGQSV